MNDTETLPLAAEGQGVVEVEAAEFNLREYFVDSEGVFQARGPFPVVVSKTEFKADNTDMAVITGIPEGAVINIEGEDYPIEGGTLELTSPVPATYNLKSNTWPYQDWEITIEAVTE